ncbi:hypothetical protein AB4076_14530 [Dyella sp. 2RAF44]|uniref:hypothetical protein n=1 Tax=Dyella sp. 2RAF44 TaxID=3233000 RepID=UPI003F92C952
MFKDDMMPKPDPQWMVDAFHPYRIALNGDALAPWQMIAIAVITVVIALVNESRGYAKRKKPFPGFRSGVLMGMLVATTMLGPLSWISYRVLSSGAIRCLMKRCQGTQFTDISGRRHYDSDRYVSMTFDPAFFWTSYLMMSCFTVIALMLLFSCIRACLHWRELD